jgi:transposase-like protein
VVKIRDGQVRSRPSTPRFEVDLYGHKDILGMWAATVTARPRNFGSRRSPELRNRGVKDILFLVCDALNGLPDSVSATLPLAVVQSCIIHLISNTLGCEMPR